MAKVVVLKKAKKPVRRVAVNRDPVILTYRALAPMAVADADMMDPDAGETTHVRRFGDYVPEASQWRRIDTWLITKRIEQVHINKSELDRWWEEYKERIALEDEEKLAANEVEAELLELERRKRELEAKLGKKNSPPDFNAAPDRRAQPLEQKIDLNKPVQDLGGVRYSASGPVELPEVTRAPLPQENVGEVRRRPTVVRKAVRRKV